MIKRFLAIILMTVLLLSCFTISVNAATTASIKVENTSVTAGGYVYVYFRAYGFSDVQALDFEIFYDSSAMSVYSVAKTGLLSSSTFTYNSDEIGVVKVSCISASGINSSSSDTSSNRLMYVRFKVNSDCEAGDYAVNIAVGDVYDGSFSPVSVSGASGKVTVSAPTAQSFTLNQSVNKSSVYKDDVVTLTLNHTSSQTFSSADFQIEYDREVFEFVELTLHKNLTVEGAVYSVNSNIQGTVFVSYASTNAISSYYLLTAKFKVIADVDGSSNLKTTATDVYNNDLQPYKMYSTSNEITLNKQAVVIDYRDIFMDKGEQSIIINNEVEYELILEKGSDVAAGDFTVSYDVGTFSCVSVKQSEGIADIGGLVVINNNYKNGIIKFSYVNESAYSDTDVSLITLTLIPLKSPSEHFAITVSGSNVVDADFDEVLLEYVTESDCVFDSTVIAPTCSEKGFTLYSCLCGESFETDYTAMIDHAFNERYSKCDNCSFTREPILGDVDDNGLVNASDAVYLMYFTLYGQEEYPIYQKCDFNASGITESDDAVYLLYHALFGDDYILN